MMSNYLPEVFYMIGTRSVDGADKVLGVIHTLMSVASSKLSSHQCPYAVYVIVASDDY